MASKLSNSNVRQCQNQNKNQPKPTYSVPPKQINPTSPKPHRAFKSLAISVLIPLSVTSFSVYNFGSSHRYTTSATSFYFLPLWFVHLAELVSSSLTGFAAWFVWVDGGFSGPRVDPLALYVSHVAMCVTWDPLVLQLGAVPVGFILCVVNFGTTVGMYDEFRKVNRVAGQLVRPCMAWIAMLTLVTFKLIDVSKVVDTSEMRMYD